MANDGRVRHIAVLVEASNSYARRLVVGIQKYAASAGWSLYMAEHSRKDVDFSWLNSWTGDGMLARIESSQAATFVRSVGLPTVDLSAGRFAPELPGVETDDQMISAWAVRHFTERGLRTLAFVGDPTFAWSNNRGSAFAAEVGRMKIPLTGSFQMSLPWADNRARLAAWLLELPKPAGVFACYDIVGQEVLEACKAIGVQVPNEVSVLGVDNDPFIDNLTSPPLSSIEPDAVGSGFMAAGLLDQLMEGELVAGGQRLVPPTRVVTRRSTDMIAVNDPIVARAVEFIRENSARAVQPAEVLLHVGLCRRALDQRFNKALGRTIHEEIARARLARVTELLSFTDLTLQQVSQRLGFDHAEYLGYWFKKQTGTSPGAFRRASAV